MGARDLRWSEPRTGRGQTSAEADGDASTLTSEHDPSPIRIRGRGVRMLMCRSSVAFVLAYCTAVLLAEDAGWAALLVAAVVLLWQLWLLRVGLVVEGSVVRLQGPFRSRSIPLGEIRSFGLARNRRVMDHFEREVCLVLHLADGSELMWRWVGWRDLISGLLVGAERPPRASQQRVLDRLNGALDEPPPAAEPVESSVLRRSGEAR